MVYRVFSSLKTSVWLLGLMCVFYLLGTVFPQGASYEEYAEQGGRFLTLVRTFGLLDVFVSPLFLFLSGLLCINLIVCIYDRFTAFLKRPKIIPKKIFLKNPALLRLEGRDMETVLKALRALGYKEIACSEGVYAFHKGLPYWWLSWLYHLGMVVAIGGFLLTALSAFEKDVTLYKGQEKTISLWSPETRINKFLKTIGAKIPAEKKERQYGLTLKDFKTEYYQTLKVDYPKGWLNRMAFGLGWRPKDAHTPKPSLSPKMWQTELEVKTPAGKVINASLAVNKPFRAEGVTLYQMAYEQRITWLVNGKPLIANTMEPFEIKGIKGKFITSSLKTGELYKKDGSKEKIEPYLELFFTPEGGQKKSLGELSQGGSITFDGRHIVLKGFEEASILSYRVDPGVPLIEVSVWLVFLGLTLRCLGYYSRVQITEETGQVFLLVSTRGLFANKDRVIGRLKEAVSNDV